MEGADNRLMYTDGMRRAFKSLDHYCPKNFRLEILDNNNFLTVAAEEKVFMSLPNVEVKRQAVEYMIRVKKALEAEGAIVLLVRRGGKEE